MSMNFNPSLYTSNPKDVTSLDDDLSSSRLVKYQNLSKIVAEWILKVLGTQEQISDLVDYLQDGSVLCKLVNQIEQDFNNGANKIKFKDSAIPFMQMENISFFLDYCKKTGVPQDELFLTVDLFEQKDPYQVCLTIQSFSRCLNKKFGDGIQIIGPKIFDKPPVPRKPKNLQARNYSSKNPNWSTVEYGYMGGSNQNTEKIVFGGNRNIIRDNNI